MGDISIHTLYGGRHYRSRTEARWAVFLDSLGVEFDYELDGKDLPSGRYLPDFWIPCIKSWIEIKGQAATSHERAIARQLCIATESPVYIFAGGIRATDSHGSPVPVGLSVYRLSDVPGEAGEDDGYSWCQCFECDTLAIRFNGRNLRKDACVACGAIGLDTHSVELMRAYRAAMSARFEFGETPMGRAV